MGGYKVYFEKEYKRYSFKDNVLDFFIKICGSALVLITVSTLFDSFNIADIQTALIAAVLIALLNVTVKPVLFVLTLPVTLITLGLFYPFVNAIILNIVEWFLKPSFEISGFWTLFFVSIFISILNMLMTNLIVDPLIERRG